VLSALDSNLQKLDDKVGRLDDNVGRLDADLQTLNKKVDAVDTKLTNLELKFADFKGSVFGAVVVNVGAYLGPVFAFFALANAIGLFEKLK
jgi:predicted  nucleic acid-binding Zn-ribbon protein